MKPRGLLASIAAVLLLVQLAMPSSSAAANKLGISCQDCLVVAKLLEHNVWDLEKDKSKLAPEETDVRTGRKLPVRLSEAAVDGVLDSLCGDLELRVGDHAERLASPCKKLLDAYRDDLDALIFQDGWRLLRQRLCSDWTDACNAHALFDSGEL